MPHHTSVYRIYLLTIWQNLEEAELGQAKGEESLPANRPDATWRFALEDPHTGQRRGFVSLLDLVAALQAEFPDPRSQAEP